ncbi:MAG: hypothetical protein ACOYVF_04485, partial [Candidatus Zixiibacteriota bacterium]
MIDSFFSFIEGLSEPMCWALFDSLWQGALAAPGLFLLLKLVRVRYARTRYALACLALALIPVLTAHAFITNYGFSGSFSTSLTETAIPSLAAEPTAGDESDHEAALPSISLLNRAHDTLSPWLFFVWLGGVGLLTFYHLAGWLRIRITLWGAIEPFDPTPASRYAQLVKTMALDRPVRIVKSLSAGAPCV